MRISVISYGAGNSGNVSNAFRKLGATVSINNSYDEWADSDAVVLPGVGAFGSAMKNLDKEAILLLLDSGKPFLGICLGMQVLFQKSEESQYAPGLGILSGNVIRFRTKLPVPHMGWNNVTVSESCPLFDGLPEFYAYFVHSYLCKPTGESRTAVCATTNYGTTFASAMWKSNIFATQFHPEKSGECGLGVLKNFLDVVKR